MATVGLEGKRKSRVHPQKFALWVGCASIVMMFAAMTSAYIVRQSGGNWLEFRLPDVFFYNTVVILLSSATLHGAVLAFRKMKTALYQGLLLASFILGLAFIVLQYEGWMQLIDTGIELTTNPSSSFLYVISGLHAAHVLGGVVAILIALLIAVKNKHVVTPLRELRLEMVAHYWHFVDGLWLYLYVFLLMQQ